MSDLTAAVEALRASPLHAMSLSAHELFFSNLLGWAAELFPVQSEQAWAPEPVDGTGAAPVRVRREWRHLDLVLEFPGRRPLVVENKSLSMPDESQLARYDQVLGEAVAKDEVREPTRVLLSPVDPGWPGGTHTTPSGGTWRWLSYADLAAHLDDAFAHAGSTYEAETVRRLAELMTRLQAVLASEAGQPGLDQPFAVPRAAMAELQRARVHHLVVKARARHVGGLIRQRLTAQGLDGAVAVLTNMTRGTPLVEGLPTDTQGTARPSTGDRFLWQLQGRDLRLAAVLPSLTGRTAAARVAREAAAAVNSAWFDFEPAREVLGHRCGAESTAWLRFDPDYVYRKVTVADLTVGDVVELGTAYSARLAEAGMPVVGGAPA